MLDAFRRPPTHIGRICAVTLRILGADDRQRFLLIEARDRPTLESIGLSPILERGVVEGMLRSSRSSSRRGCARVGRGFWQ